MLLLCVFDSDEIQPLHNLETTIDSIRRVRQLLEPWVNLDLTVSANIQRLDNLMRLKGIQVPEA
jgi:hypothetical protein